ncbi:glycosyltransferases [Candidatus Scalindua japonica]|uniref:Glycosyltransferases n=1 Tax=Candidatus Scalindua japonica TaxID=1284222 RepID=A0A286U4E5_9BACT|nr:glycosyltransferase family 2 protein [Candidatus Scalindua japonica]GAX62984.1 glycosyltransferases [Candidatus Scalindua japonica]
MKNMTSDRYRRQIDISVVIPLFNEEESLPVLYEKLKGVLEELSISYEIIFVDDGSTDNSYEIISKIQNKNSCVKTIKFRTNAGKAKALNRGFKVAGGNIVFTMDADLQDDPEEIPNFLSKINEGYDLVSGWKKKRHDPLEKRLPSKLFNKITSLFTGLKLHDFNCGFKAYKREILDEISVYGELHRYIPALAHWQGYRVGEIPIKHHPRKFGESKYGLKRYIRGFFDLFTVVLLTKYIRTPIYLFGFTGSLFLTVGFLILFFITYLQITYGSILGHRPLSYFGVLSVLFGSQSISLGFLSEMLANISQAKGGGGISIRNYIGDNQKETGDVDLSIVVPLYNERESISILHNSLKLNLSNSGKNYEIVFVDDGSNDGSFDILMDIYGKNDRIKIIQLRKRFGKASALQAGFNYSVGEIIITMDADLQDSPGEIHHFIKEIDKGCNFVIGHRTEVPLFSLLSSAIFNKIVSLFSRVTFSDINCGLKAFKRSVIKDLRLYGELHRYFPILIARKGYKIEEIKVAHNPRQFGKSKYGITRIPKAFLDLFTIVLLTGFQGRPLHFFGGIGVSVGLVGLSINAYLCVLKFIEGNIGNHYTLLLMGVMLMVLGLQWFSAGILSELVNGIYEREFGEDIEG